MAPQGGFGAVIKISIASVMTAVAHVSDVQFPEFENMIADITAHDSPGGYTETIPAGKSTLNPFSINVFWDADSSTHAALQTAYSSRAKTTFSVEDPDGVEVITFDGYVSKIGRVSPQEDGYNADIEITPTGAPTIT